MSEPKVAIDNGQMRRPVAALDIGDDRDAEVAQCVNDVPTLDTSLSPRFWSRY